MARTTYIRAADLRSGGVLLKAAFADPSKGDRSFFHRVQRDQREVLAEDTFKVQAKYGFPEEWKYVEFNNTRRKDWVGHPSSIMMDMKAGTRANMFSQGVDRDLMKVLRDVYSIVKQLSPVRPATMRGPHPRGLYRRSHEIWVNGKKSAGGSGGADLNESSYGQILSRIDYASTLETADFKRQQPYQKAFRKALSKYRSEWDLRLEYANADFFGGNIRTSRYTAKRKTRVYTIPVITVAPLNSLPDAGKFISIKRRGKNARTNVLSRRPARSGVRS